MQVGGGVGDGTENDPGHYSQGKAHTIKTLHLHKLH